VKKDSLQPILMGYSVKKVPISWINHTPDMGMSSFRLLKVGGGRFSNCSILQAIQVCEKIADKKLKCSYVESNHIGDHIWWISDNRKFKSHYPEWDLNYGIEKILKEIFEESTSRWL